MAGGLTRLLAGLTRTWLVPACAAAAIVQVAGCSSGSAVAAGPTGRWPISASTGLPSQVLLIFSYLQSPAQADTFNQAYNILVAQCMARWGFADPTQVHGAEPPPMYRRYGITSMAVASRWGYHLQPGSALLQTSPGTPPMSDAENAVFLGTRSRILNPHYSPFGNGKRLRVAGKLVPPGGCAGAAIIRLNAYGPAASPYLPNQINLNDSSASQADPAVVAVFAAWSRCMAAKGYTLANPLQAGDGFNISTPKPSQQEIDMAVADVRCKDQTHVVSVWFGVEYRLQETSIQRNFTALSAIRAKLAEEQRAALAVIASVTG